MKERKNKILTKVKKMVASEISFGEHGEVCGLLNHSILATMALF